MRLTFSVITAVLGTVLLAPADAYACGGRCCRTTSCMPAMSNHTAMPMNNGTAGYFCPMHPQVVGKANQVCPICAMPLAKRAGTAASQPANGDSKVKAALAKLSPEDRKLAEAQGYCAIQTDSRLGSMGTPIKVMIKDQPVFLCCAGCKAEALANPDKTLATVARLKAPAKAPSGQ